MTFTIMKRINTELFIDKKAVLYLQNGEHKIRAKVKVAKCCQQRTEKVRSE